MYEAMKRYGPLSIPGALFNAIVSGFLAVSFWVDDAQRESSPAPYILTLWSAAFIGLLAWRLAAYSRERRGMTIGSSEEECKQQEELNQPAEPEGDQSPAPWDGGSARFAVARRGPWRGRRVDVSRAAGRWLLSVAPDQFDASDPAGSSYELDEEVARQLASTWSLLWFDDARDLE